MKYFLLFAALFCASSLFAQEEVQWKEPSSKSLDYNQSRYIFSTPPYELAKIKALISKPESGVFPIKKLSAQVYNMLSLREKFTYHMIHAENYSQTCRMIPRIRDEDKKIFAHLPDIFGEYSWSERQYDFLRGQRDSVMALIKEYVTQSKRMGANYKIAVETVNGWEMIPFLIDLYNKDKKDNDILTLLMLLIKQQKYQPFMLSAFFNKLYNEDTNYKSYIDLNEANQNLILEHAHNFYKSKK